MADILVVEDEEYVRKAIKRTLEKEGHNIEEASNGLEGKNCCDSKEYDIIIFDVIMPKKGGLEMLLEVRNKCAKTKFMIISGKVPTESNAYFTFVENFGVKKVLQKPYKKEDLINAVNELLEG